MYIIDLHYYMRYIVLWKPC